MPLRPRWKIECDRLAHKSIKLAYAALRGMGTPRCEEFFAESIELRFKTVQGTYGRKQSSRASAKKQMLDSFAKGKGFMIPPTRLPDAFANAVLHEQSKANSSGPGPSQPADVSTEHIFG
eukprot:6201969-Pleurochrysis_carterae.AAC.1